MNGKRRAAFSAAFDCDVAPVCFRGSAHQSQAKAPTALPLL